MTSARAFFQRSSSVERLSARASAFFGRLQADSRGAGLVEYMIILGFIALFAIGVLTRYGSVIHDGLQSEASRIEGENLPTTGDLLGSLGNVTPSVCDLSSSRFCARGSGSPIPSLGALGTKGGVPGMDDLGSEQRKGFASRVSEGSGFGVHDVPDLGEGMDRLGQVPDEPGALARATPSSGFVEDKTGRRSIDDLLNGERSEREVQERPPGTSLFDPETEALACEGTPEECAEIVQRNIEAVRDLEWELFYTYSGIRLGQWAWRAFKAWRAARAAGAAARGVARPTVMDPKLSNLVRDLYKGANTKNPIGTGSTADAIRHEAATGQAVGGKFHTQKGTEYARALENWLNKNPGAAAGDRSAAQAILDDLRGALGGK